MTGSAAPEDSPLDRRLEIETPERVRIVHDLAGIGSRFSAGFLDVVILSMLFCVAGTLVAIVAGVTTPQTEEQWTAFGLAAFGVFFAVVAVYYGLFEVLWAGQTPGKRVFRLRVVSQDGGPAPAAAILVRNVLRLADAFPFAAPYALGGLVMFASRTGRRIGDFAAGTIVVRERLDAAVLPPRAAAPEGEEFAAADVERARAFVLRAPQLFAERRAELSRAIAADIASRHGLAFADAEQFLRLVAQRTSLERLRAARGPQP